VRTPCGGLSGDEKLEKMLLRTAQPS
jgi:hypothetical protein